VWLLSVAANFSRDLLRKRGRRGLVLGEERIHAQAAEGGSPADSAEASEEHERLRDAVARLPDDKRLAVVLRYFEGMSLGEMAEVTGVEVNTLKVRLHRARKDLLEMVDGTE
jgi:RNA polymerase sigma-70 factor (ECF subfamily)